MSVSMAKEYTGHRNVKRRKGKYGRHVVVMRNGRISHNYTWLAGLAVVALMLVICFVVGRSSGKLEDKNNLYDKQIAELDVQIADQNERRDELNTRSVYVTTKQFIEEFAREKLGLVYEDELIFRANDNDN